MELAGTVERWDPAGGSVLLDSGARLLFTGSVVRPQVRRLHPGQRVRLAVDGERVDALTLPGLPLH